MLHSLLAAAMLATCVEAGAEDIDPTQQQLCDTMYYYFDMGQRDRFIESNKRYMDYCLEHGNLKDYYIGWTNLIIFELNESNIYQAYRQALAMSRNIRERNADEYYYLSTSALGLIYADCNNLEGARQCFLETLEEQRRLRMTDDLAPVYMDLAYVTIDKNPAEALEWATKAKLISADDNALCDASAFKGMLEFKQRNYPAFLDSYRQYKELERRGKTSIYGKFIEIYHACYKRDFRQALRKADSLSSPLDRHDFLRQVYDYKGDSLQAYRVLRRQMDISDSLNSAILTDNLRGISNELEIAEAQRSEARHRIVTLYVFGIAAVLLIMGLAYHIYNRRKFTKQLEAGHSQLLKAYDQLEETTTAKERIESELRIARDIQMSMVPSRFPERRGLDLYASMTPAREVGGDLYDYILQDQKLYFCVGDVSGKGVPASLLMAQAIRLFRALAKQGLPPAQIATRLNEELSENNENGMFVTMFIALADLTDGHLWFCNAGHNPPVIGGGQDNGHFVDMEPNAPIGLWPGLSYVGEEIASISRRPLFVYTDGLTEAENLSQQQFGDERLLQTLRRTNFESARQVISQLSREVEAHRGGAEPSDDLTMLCLKIDNNK